MQALVLFSISCILAAAVVALARAQRLNFRYLIGWMLICLVGVFASLGLPFLVPLSNAVDLTSGTLMAAFAVVLLLIISIQLSVSISGSQDLIRSLAEDIALERIAQTSPQATSRKLEVTKYGNKQTSSGGRFVVLVPAFNEEDTISSVVRMLIEAGYPVLVVNDASTDRTGLLARQAGAEVIDLPVNLGVGGALKTGFRAALKLGYSTVVQVDADGQHPVSQIPLLLRKIDEGYDYVAGSRFLTESLSMDMSFVRRKTARLLAAIATRRVGQKVSDTTSGFRCISGPLLTEFSRNFSRDYLGDTFGALISAGRSGYAITEISADIIDRQGGTPSTTAIRSSYLVAKCIVSTALGLYPKLQESPNHSP